MCVDGNWSQAVRNSIFVFLFADPILYRRTEDLNLEATSIKMAKSGHIEVDKFENTSVEGVCALGDVTTTGRERRDTLFIRLILVNFRLGPHAGCNCCWPTTCGSFVWWREGSFH